MEDAAIPHFHGHRQRLRERFMEAGESALADYELMELLLFRAIPRRDVKPLAKTLVERFGSFAGALADRHGDRTLFLETDVAQTQQVTRLVDTAVERFGALHVMVNNAGVSGKMQRSLLDDDLGDFERVMAINVKAVMAGTRDAARHMTETGGSIINLSSVAGRLGFPLRTPYAATKWAVVGLTKSLAMELGPNKIRVNAIQPGIVRVAVPQAVHSDELELLAQGLAEVDLVVLVEPPDLVIAVAAVEHELQRLGVAVDAVEDLLHRVVEPVADEADAELFTGRQHLCFRVAPPQGVFALQCGHQIGRAHV